MNSRLQNLRKLLSEQKLDAMLVSSLSNITYLSNFSGFTTEDRDAYLLITKKAHYIFTHGIYKEAVGRHVRDFTLIDITRENPISATLKKIIVQEKVERIGFESFDLKVNEYEKLIEKIDTHMLAQTNIISELRIIKTDDEIEAIKKACKLGDQAFDFILKKIKQGITEIALGVELEFFVKSHGADLCFPSVVAFGSHASMPHHVPTNTKLKQNQFVLLDFGIRLNNYCSDMTRTIFFGKASKKEKNIYEIVRESQQNAIDTLNFLLLNGSLIKASEVDKVAREYLISQGFDSMPHSLGHGIGLDVHESPRLTPASHEIVKEGMVFSIEPGTYLPGKFGIRIEDIFAISHNKLIQLTKSPRELIEL